MIFVEVRLDHPILREALRAAPEIELEWVRNTCADEGREMLFWAEGSGFETFEAGLENDTTVTVSRSLGDGSRSLYQVKVIGEGLETDLYPTLVENGGIVISATVTDEGWFCRFGIPDQTGVDRFFAAAERHDVGFDVYRISGREDAARTRDFGLTELQRETLLAAFEAGYFDVPRRATQKDLGQRFGTSDTAISQRVRRGIKRLVANTVATESDRTSSTPTDRSR